MQLIPLGQGAHRGVLAHLSHRFHDSHSASDWISISESDSHITHKSRDILGFRPTAFAMPKVVCLPWHKYNITRPCKLAHLSHWEHNSSYTWHSRCSYHRSRR